MTFATPPSESFQSFQRSPLLGSQLRLTPPCFPKNHVIPPPKILRAPPSPPEINNDRSLRLFKILVKQGSHGQMLKKETVMQLKLNNA